MATCKRALWIERSIKRSCRLSNSWPRQGLTTSDIHRVCFSRSYQKATSTLSIARCYGCTRTVLRISCKKRRETKQQQSRTKWSHHLGCCLVSVQFLSDILTKSLVTDLELLETNQQFLYPFLRAFAPSPLKIDVLSSLPSFRTVEEADSGHAIPTSLSYANGCLLLCLQFVWGRKGGSDTVAIY